MPCLNEPPAQNIKRKSVVHKLPEFCLVFIHQLQVLKNIFSVMDVFEFAEEQGKFMLYLLDKTLYKAFVGSLITEQCLSNLCVPKMW